MSWFTILGLIVVGCPAALVAILGVASIIDRPLSERPGRVNSYRSP